MASSKPRHNSEPWNDPKTCADAAGAPKAFGDGVM